MALSFSTLTIIGSCIAIVVWWVSSRRRLPLPPGPPADPIIGHLRVIPTGKQDETFHSWAKVYGDVIQLRLLGSSIVVLDSVQAANDLLDKSGANFSCRPKCRVFEMMGWVPNLVFLPYGAQSIKHRKLFQRYFGRQEALSYLPYQSHQACVLVKNLLANPGNYDQCLRRFATATIIKIAYGHDIESDDDHFLKITEEIGQAINNSGPVGNTPVDWFPFLQHLPSWFPGTHYANHAKAWKGMVRKLYDDPVEEIQKHMTEGTAPPCFLSSELEDSSDRKEPNNIDDVKGVAATMYAAGVDTTWSALGVFLFAMILHPECQRKAQEEIDMVIGSDRLPEFSDRERLPYIECIVQETLRWKPVVALGVPHRSLHDEVYKDMFIPKGSVVFSNITGMSLDESTYFEPHKFNPERFIAEADHPAEPYFTAAFGFGRRICPGRFLADASLWIAIASVLATLNVSKAVGKDGREITPEMDFSTGIVNHLKQVPCVIRPRSWKHETLINECL